MINKHNSIITNIKKAKSPYLIAEIGINHNGNMKLAKKMIKSAKENGAHCVKFQLFSADDYISKFASKAKYQDTKNTKKSSQFEIIKKTQITIDQFKELNEYSRKINIDFLCTPFELESFRKMMKSGVKSVKISSCNLDNTIFLKEIAKSNIEVLLSTGMGNIEEVQKAYKIFKNKKKLIIFQCTSNYPSNLKNSNLNVIKTYKKMFRVPIGFSDHTVGNISSIVSVAFGAVAIEKHFTISKKLPGIDQQASIEPYELLKLSEDIKNAKLTLGSYEKNITSEEKNTAVALRRSLVASKDIFKGEVLKKSHISIKRPGNGLSVNNLKSIIGKKTKRKIRKDELFKLINLK